MKLNPVGAAAPAHQAHTEQLRASTRAGASAASVAAPDIAVGAQAVLVQAAQAQLAEMPEVDLQRVQEIRRAFARGEITFDATKLAALVQRYHGGRG